MEWVRRIMAVILGLGLGVFLGLVLGWVVWPTEYSEATPQLLNDAYKRDYVIMVATTYAQDEDLTTAQQYISRLGTDGSEYIFNLMLDMILSQNNPQDIQNMVFLADALGHYSPAMQPYLPQTEEPNGS